MNPLHLTDMIDWQGCAHRYELKHVSAVEMKYRYPEAINGTAIHRVIDQIHRMRLWSISPDAMKEMYRAAFSWAVANPKREKERNVPVYWGEYLNEEEAALALQSESLAMLQGYVGDPRNHEANLILCEGEWRHTFEGTPWTGTIDQVRRLPDGRAWIVDVKSGKSKIEPTTLQMWMQGLGYSVALEHAEFRDSGTDQWAMVSLDVAQISWLHLRDYIPYQKSGKAPKTGRVYKAGESRGPAFYTVDVTPQAKTSMLKEMKLFADAVRVGPFPRSPDRHCSYCPVSEQCLLGFHGSIASLQVDPSSLTYEEQSL